MGRWLEEVDWLTVGLVVIVGILVVYLLVAHPFPSLTDLQGTIQAMQTQIGGMR